MATMPIKSNEVDSLEQAESELAVTRNEMLRRQYISTSVTSDVTRNETYRQRDISASVTQKPLPEWILHFCDEIKRNYPRRRKGPCSHHLMGCKQCWQAQQALFASGRWSNGITQRKCTCGRTVYFQFIHRKTHLHCWDCDVNHRSQLGAKWRQENRPKPLARSCDYCSETYEPKRSGSLFCSTKCRVYANRAKRIGGAS